MSISFKKILNYSLYFDDLYQMLQMFPGKGTNEQMPSKTISGFELDDFHRNVPDDELIADLVRTSQQLGKNKITFREYNVNGKYHSSTATVRFGSWLNALKKAGLEKTKNRNVPNEDLFRNVVAVWSKLGHQPKFRDLTRDTSEYSATTYANRFGSWTNALREFVAWANDEGVTPEPSEFPQPKSRKTPRNVNWKLRAQVLMRDGAQCKLCGASPRDGVKLHVDHIYPWSKGGETTIDNLQILCEVCHIGKCDMADSRIAEIK
ncbi:HNH endonuclease [Methylocapsa sp. D3K7]|uniref:homing endonuclease associated repeat-containing protein n=1 Tax=Methylocapsa sp. D3K7 TaxID=3041435 RepID=UPI00244E6FF5|nr:HNH endonuclease [Methylocapsa sp. D3K7]WGJ13576.1 HNH endonuclease [Methylocapsa sp. D3K7]